MARRQMDIEQLTAIDVHTHVHASVHDEGSSNPTLAAMAERFGTELPSGTVPALAEYYRAKNMAAVTFTVDEWSRTGQEPSPTNDEVLELAAEHADVLIPFASIDPARGIAGVREARRLLNIYGVRGFKFHPSTQEFFPNERHVYPLYELLEEHQAVALFHSGQTGVGSGERSGGGIRLKYSNPMAVDDVAVDFPDMPIILAHPSFPWQEEALAVAVHKPQVYLDLSGWSPKYFPPILVQYANSLLRHKVLFGTDFPLLTPERWLEDFDKTSIKEEVKPHILKKNATQVLGLEEGA